MIRDVKTLFSLNREEIMGRSQTVISSEIKFSKSVGCFTVQGVAMFSSVLKSIREAMIVFVRSGRPI